MISFAHDSAFHSQVRNDFVNTDTGIKKKINVID